MNSRINVKIQELRRLEMEPWRAVEAHIGGMEFHNGAVEGLYVDQTYVCFLITWPCSSTITPPRTNRPHKIRYVLPYNKNPYIK
jgi:hypothetical protein